MISCQSYEPSPLEPAAHRAAWHARSLADLEGLRLDTFVERLAPAGGEAPKSGEAAVTDGELLDASDGLTLAEGRLVALVYNPDLRLARLRAGVAAVSAENAGLWADPQLSFQALRATDSSSDAWILSPQLGFTIPLSGRLGAQRELAAAEHSSALQSVREAEWQLELELRRAWITWSAAQLRVAETERFVASTDALVRSVTGLAQAGELRRTEATLFTMERARRANQARGLRGLAAAAEQRLRAILGLSPDAALTLVPHAVDPAPLASSPDELAARNPSLARLRAAYAVAEERLRVELRKQYPDLTLGPAYELDQGQSFIGLTSGLRLPFLNANRRAIAEARAGRELARAAFETEYERLVGRWSAARTELAARTEQRGDMEAVLVPLVDGQVEAALKLLQLGEGASLVLLESIVRSYETKLELIEARAAEALARAQVEFLTGPPLPTQETP